MDLLNTDTANSNTYSSLDPYSLETLPPLSFLADASLLFEGHSRRNESSYQDGLRLTQRNQRTDIINSSTVAWSNHESFDLLINAAISEGLYDQNSRLSPPNLADGLLSYGSEVSSYNLVDISQSSQQSNSSAYADSLETSNEKVLENEKLNNGVVFCRIENNVLSIDLRQLFTQHLLSLAKSLKHKVSETDYSVPILIKFPSSDVNVKFRVDKLWPTEEVNEFQCEKSVTDNNNETAKDNDSTSFPALIVVPPEETLVVTSANEVKRGEDGKKCWKCHLCQEKFFKTRHSLKLHFNRHAKKNTVECSYCRKTFAQLAHMQSHVLRCHAPKRLRCRGCQLKFSHRKLLLNHMIKQCKVNEAESIRCERCPDTTFVTVRQLGEHFLKNFTHYVDSVELEAAKTRNAPSPPVITTVSNNKEIETKFICDICNAAFASSRRLSDHKSRVHRKKHECAKCGKKFGKKNSLTVHQRICKVSRKLQIIAE